tara:strand:- start:1498 stop:2139 length:642 start_codon:yes stop_codon:yes gene_type:complete
MTRKVSVILDEVFPKIPHDKRLVIENYLSLLLKWHNNNNIISSSDTEYVIKREIYDSYQFSNLITGKTFTDIGTGGGIPGIIIAILNPDKEIVLLDRKSTYIDFLRIAQHDLGLNNVNITEQDFFVNKFQLNTETVLFKNFSNKKIAKMQYEKKLIYMIDTVKNSKSVKKVYLLTGTPVLELSEDFVEDYKLTVKKISSPFFPTSRYFAEVLL